LAGLTIAIFCASVILGASKPLLILLTSSIAELSGGVPAMLMDTPCCAKELKVKSRKLRIRIAARIMILVFIFLVLSLTIIIGLTHTNKNIMPLRHKKY
jgi:hypothetical protein